MLLMIIIGYDGDIAADTVFMILFRIFLRFERRVFSLCCHYAIRLLPYVYAIARH